MVIPPVLYYLFAPFLMGIIGVLADKFNTPKLNKDFSDFLFTALAEKKTTFPKYL